MGLAGGHDPVEQGTLILGRDPQLVAEVAGVIDPGEVNRDHPEVDLAEGHEREGLGREVEIGRHGLEDIPRTRPGYGQADQPEAQHVEPHAAVRRQVVAEPARMMDLCRQRPEQVELVRLGGSCDREFADDAACIVEHRGQGDAAGRRHARRQQRGQPGLGAWPYDPVLGVIGDLRHADPFTDRRNLRRYLRPRVGAPERDLLPWLQPRFLKPQRVLKPERRAPHGVGGGQSVVDRRRQQRSGVGQLLVREGDPESASIILLDLGVGVRERGVVPIPGHIHAPDIHAGIAVVARSHPGREGQTHAPALREAGHDAAGNPVAAQPADRPDQRVAVRREREWSVDDSLDADRAHRRVVLERDGQLGRDALQVRLEQSRPEVPRRLAR